MKLQLFVLLAVVALALGDRSRRDGVEHGNDKNMNKEIESAFTKNEIVPDVLTSSPGQLLKVKYTKSGKEVNLGNEIFPVDLLEIPDISYEANSNDYYTLIFTDPDAPSREDPNLGEFRHWLVVNIPGSDVSKGQELSAYIRSGPPKGTGLHRYIFLLYKQPKELNFEEKKLTNKEIGDRAKWSAKKFAEKYNLELKAGNFYQAQYDDSVPALHKQLGFTPPE